jgi:hypothetical protein
MTRQRGPANKHTMIERHQGHTPALHRTQTVRAHPLAAPAGDTPTHNSEHVFEDEDKPHESQGWTMLGRLISSLEQAKHPLMHATIACLYLSPCLSPISILADHTRLSQSIQWLSWVLGRWGGERRKGRLIVICVCGGTVRGGRRGEHREGGRGSGQCSQCSPAQHTVTTQQNSRCDT